MISARAQVIGQPRLRFEHGHRHILAGQCERGQQTHRARAGDDYVLLGVISTMLKRGFAFFDEGLHAFLLILQSEARVEHAPLEYHAFRK